MVSQEIWAQFETSVLRLESFTSPAVKGSCMYRSVCWCPDIVVHVCAAGCTPYRWTRCSAGWKTYGTWRRWSACAFCSLNPSAWTKTLQVSSSYPGRVPSASTSLVITCRRCWRGRWWSARSWGRCSNVWRRAAGSGFTARPSGSTVTCARSSKSTARPETPHRKCRRYKRTRSEINDRCVFSVCNNIKKNSTFNHILQAYFIDDITGYTLFP